MKTFIFVLTFLSSIAYASSIDSHTLPVFGTQSEDNFALNTTKTRTAYREQTVPQTCYRGEFDGYRNYCEYYPETSCYPSPRGPMCSTRSVYRCTQQPQYRQVAYTCYQSISVPYEVIDHEVKANINVIVASAPKEPTNPQNNCPINFVLNGETLTTEALCNDYIILSNVLKVSSLDQTGATVDNYKYTLNLLDPQIALAPLEGGIVALRKEGDKLSFRIGNVEKNPNFSIKLFIEKTHLLKKDETLIDRQLTVNEFTYSKLNDTYGIVQVDLKKLLGGLEEGKKHNVKVELSVSLGAGTILNRVAPALETEATTTIK